MRREIVHLERSLDALPADPRAATVEQLVAAVALGESVARQLNAAIAGTRAAQRRLARSRGDGDALAALIDQLARGRQLQAAAERLHDFTTHRAGRLGRTQSADDGDTTKRRTIA